MPINGKTHSYGYDDERVGIKGHGPVLITAAFAAGQGVLPIGLVLAKDVDGNLVPQAGEAVPVAVLDEVLDTAQATAGVVVIHGTVRRDVLKVGAAAPTEPDAAMLRKLQDSGIYPV
ncbi:head decoration protein [Desulfocurvibacter africanus]|uniref:head decoration protein n=1 Tax=Desulfocurvibacter africanus TaxID=873 RepID=UPI002FDA8E1A